MKSKMKLLAVPALFALSSAANAGIIDLFSTDQALLEDNTNGAFTSADAQKSQAGSAIDTTILGGYRDLVVSALSGAGGPLDKRAAIGVGGGVLSYSNDNGVASIAEVQWDGDDSAGDIFDIDYTGLGGIDLTLGGVLSGFEITTNFSDLNWVFEIAIYTDATTWTMVSLDASSVPGPAPHVGFVPFSAFTNPFLCGTYGAAPGVNTITCGVGGNVDVTNVGALVARLNVGDPNAPDGTGSAPIGSTVSVDLELAQITTVPEPGVLGLMGAGLLALGGLSRRRKAAAAQA